MLRRSEGFTTGIMRYKPNKYELISGVVLDSISAQQKDKNTSMDENDASMECSRIGCDAFVRKNQDGETTYYKLTTPYYGDADYKNPELAGNYEIMYLSKPSSTKESFIVVERPNKPPVYIDERIIFLFVAALILLLVYLYVRNQSTTAPEVYGRPGTSEEDDVLV